MEKRALLAVVLSLLILFLYQALVSRYYPAPPPPQEEPREEKKSETAVPAPPKPPPALQTAKPQPQGPAKPHAARETKIETDDYVALFTNQGARLKSFKLKHYRTSVDEKSPPFEMIPSVPGIPYSLGIALPGAQPSNDEGIAYSVQGSDLNLTGNNQGRLVFQGQSPTGATLTKEFTFTGSGYAIQMQTSLENAAGAPALILTSEAGPSNPNSDAPFEGLLTEVNGKVVREHGDALKAKEWSGKVSWAGFGHTYFLFAVLPEDNAEQKISVHEARPAIVMEIGPQTPSTKVAHTLFIGPKELDILKSMNRDLEHSIDFGWFAVVSIPLLYVLHFFHRFTGSWGIDIILLTVLIKLIMAPLTHKSFTSMKQMQKLQPQMERLKEKYKDDKENLNKEIMELYRRNKVNPFGGCLPMLLQFPVFIGLYNALRTPIELRHAPFLWIKDLSRPDWESLPIAFDGWHFGIPILTLLMGASMFAQQWMTPSAGDPNQRRMMLMMPLVFTFMFINFPSGLTIYWLVNNLLSIAQQYLINRMKD
ncbi:MAG TPA: membrane protein insertase YidC [Candidatus Binatia bacterium]|jgi:YidC/Oxa1 family membrane protein insertase